jgi:hypothetical protein
LSEPLSEPPLTKTCSRRVQLAVQDDQTDAERATSLYAHASEAKAEEKVTTRGSI